MTPFQAALVLVTAAIGIGAVQPGLARDLRAVRERDDLYVLPPPSILRAATLGHRAAAADILWSNVVVQYGEHIAEKRPFPDLPKYLDAILAIEPGYLPLYRYCDAFFVFSYPKGNEQDARLARHYLERGTRERPLDAEMWFRYGRFLGAMGPSFLASKEEKEQWRIDGRTAMKRAIELGLDAGAIAPHY
ncbi:hypothetical protein LVJ94_22850 [Pendulispora rubella]|uniref:Uncharacterized protein n=1 Tax=Pendulispora rubella TaxID=2741070 RepID=A0ABZ2LGJ0_9BACT